MKDKIKKEVLEEVMNQMYENEPEKIIDITIKKIVKKIFDDIEKRLEKLRKIKLRSGEYRAKIALLNRIQELHYIKKYLRKKWCSPKNP